MAGVERVRQGWREYDRGGESTGRGGESTAGVERVRQGWRIIVDCFEQMINVYE